LIIQLLESLAIREHVRVSSIRSAWYGCDSQIHVYHSAESVNAQLKIHNCDASEDTGVLPSISFRYRLTNVASRVHAPLRMHHITSSLDVDRGSMLQLERRIARLPEPKREVVDKCQLALPTGHVDEAVSRVVVRA
jgi:hypothetical protein